MRIIKTKPDKAYKEVYCGIELESIEEAAIGVVVLLVWLLVALFVVELLEVLLVVLIIIASQWKVVPLYVKFIPQLPIQ